jgi:nickel/cobalt exporter
VLTFALAQGLFLAGVAATFVMGLGTALTVGAIAVVAVSAKGIARRLTAHSEGASAVVLRGLEFAAACAVLVLGTGLLLGYLATERGVCF